MATSTDGANPDVATCSTQAEARAAVGTVCTVTGTYKLEQFYGKKGTVIRTWPVIEMSDGASVALESLWDESKMPSDQEIARWLDQPVAATGTLHGEPPADDRMANMSQLTISPVDSLRSLR